MPRKPDYWLKAMDKSQPGKTLASAGKVGAAWKNADGSISIDLNAFIVLPASPDLVLTLFPIERGENARTE